MNENEIKKSNLWSTTVDGYVIKVVNKATKLMLYVDDKMQDIYFGLFAQSSHLFGKLPNGKEVKVAFGGNLKLHCYIFVDNELVLEY